ncbi:hypothetical protein [Curtobacterium flaccumfaciens]
MLYLAAQPRDHRRPVEHGQRALRRRAVCISNCDKITPAC